MAQCWCDWCVSPADIAAKHRVSTAAQQADFGDFVHKVTGIDLDKREEEHTVAHILNKSQAGARPVDWASVLSLYARARAGEPDAERTWAAFSSADPGTAKIVPDVVRLHRPTAAKRKKSAGRERVIARSAGSDSTPTLADFVAQVTKSRPAPAFRDGVPEAPRYAPFSKAAEIEALVRAL